MRVLRCGERAALVEVDGPAAVLPLTAALRSAGLAGVEELVPAARTVLVSYDPAATTFDRLEAGLAGLRPGWAEPAAAAPDPVQIPVRYDGEDLAEVADLSGLPVREVVRRHAAGDYTCLFCGFAPGFGYLTGLDPALQVPRRDDPRTAVPAGAVAVAGEFTAVYPRRSPGGWRIIGHTGLPVWDSDRDPPALLEPGTRVRFVPVHG